MSIAGAGPERAPHPAAGKGSLSGTSGEPRGNVVFGGKGLPGLAAKGVVLTFLTFGIYRFWLLTDLRHWFWSRTRIAGSPLEYTGTGIEIFLGFLIATIILLPAYVVIGGLAGIWISEDVLTLVTLVLFVLLYFYVSYRARRYRLNRTLWRGLRFGLEGSPWVYAGRASLWLMAVVSTLGLAYPWMAAALERYRIENMRFAGNAFQSGAKGRDIAGPYFALYGIALCGILLVVIPVFWSAIADHTGPVAGSTGQSPSAAIRGVGAIAAGWAAAFCVLLIHFKAKTLSRFGSAISLGAAKIDLIVRTGRLIKIWIAYILLFVGGTALTLSVMAMIVFAVTAADPGSFPQAFSLAAFPTFIVASIGLFWLKIVYFQRAMWGAVAHGLDVRDLAHLDSLVARGQQQASGRDEGFADALIGDFEVGF